MPESSWLQIPQKILVMRQNWLILHSLFQSRGLGVIKKCFGEHVNLKNRMRWKNA